MGAAGIKEKSWAKIVKYNGVIIRLIPGLAARKLAQGADSVMRSEISNVKPAGLIAGERPK